MSKKIFKIIFQLLFWLISCGVIYFNYGGKEGPLVASYLAIPLSPLFIYAVMYLTPSNFGWGGDHYTFWFIALIITTGYLTWFVFFKRILKYLIKTLRIKMSRFKRKVE